MRFGSPHCRLPLLPLACLLGIALGLASARPASASSVSPTGGWYTAGSSVTVTAAPDAHWRFTGWSGDTQDCAFADNVITVAMSQARSIAAEFTPDQHTLTVVSEHGGEDPGTLTGDYGSLIEQWVTNSPVPGGVGTQYVCIGASVLGNDHTPVSPTNVTLTLTNDATLTWQWQTQYWLATATNGAGNVTPADGWHAAGSNAALTAVAAAHWHFAGWSGDTQDCVVVGSVITAAMTQARSIIAVFAPGNTAGLGIEQTGPSGPVLSGEAVVYNLTVTNYGPDDGLNVRVTNPVSPLLTNLTVSVSQGVYSNAAGKLTYYLGTLTNGLSATVSLGATVRRSGVVTNAATLAAQSFDLDTSDNAATQLTEVVSRPVVSNYAALRIATNGSGWVTFSNSVFDADGDLCSLDVSFSTNGGASWTNAWIRSATGTLGVVSVGTPPDGSPQVQTISTTNGVGAAMTNRVTVTWDTTNGLSPIALCTNVRVAVRVWDGAYWSDAATSAPFRVDNQPPAGPTSVWSWTHPIDGWATGRTVALAWTPADDGAGVGVKGYGYRLTNTWPAVLWPTSVATAGTNVTISTVPSGTNWCFAVRPCDSNGNWGAGISIGPFLIDFATPAAPGSLTADRAKTAVWTNQADPVFTWAAPTNCISGIAGYSYAQNGAPDTAIDTVETQFQWTGASEGTNYFRVRAQSVAGAWGPSNSFTLLVDLTPPVTTNDADAEWHTNTIVVHLSRRDALSGIGQTYFRLNGGTVTAGTNVTISTASNNHTIACWSVDKAGNLEETNLVSGIRIDKTAPVFGGWNRDPWDLKWTSSGSVRIEVRPSDVLSGIGTNVPELDWYVAGGAYDGYEPMVSAGDGLWAFDIALDWAALPGATLYYKVRARDVAGNLGTSAEQSEVIDGPPGTLILEGERFTPLDTNGWAVTRQDASYGSTTFGGMWSSQGAMLGAPKESAGSVASQVVQVQAAGTYRVWSKYQSPPYFNYLHRIEIWQNGVPVYTNDYGWTNSPRFYSFAAAYHLPPIAQCWFRWGVDHDAAEAPAGNAATLSAGPAEVRLITLENPEPAGDRMVDFVVLTTNLNDTYTGYSPNKVASPFLLDAFAAQSLYMRFSNPSPEVARLKLQRPQGHINPVFTGVSTNLPRVAVAPNSCGDWFDIGPFCKLACNEGLWLTLVRTDGTAIAGYPFEVQFSRDSNGVDVVGDTVMSSGEAVSIPMSITWDTNQTVRLSQAWAQDIISSTGAWRTANNGQKPTNILFYGQFKTSGAWGDELKEACGFNTYLPSPYATVPRSGMYRHATTPAAVSNVAASMSADAKTNFLIMSFGDEISLGTFDYSNPTNQANFLVWLTNSGITEVDLGMPLTNAYLTSTGDPHLVWYSQIFSEQARFDKYRSMTEITRQLIGPWVLTGANFSPHAPGPALYYGPIYQWIDLFKFNGMTMFWTEDYVFSVPEAPQIVSWTYATMRCAVKYNRQPMHMYVMPHSPSQRSDMLRRNALLAIGNGVAHINNYCGAPQEEFTENYMAWDYADMFRAVHETIYDTAEAEPYQVGGVLRPARVAVVLSKATEFGELHTAYPKSADLFMNLCSNAPATVNPCLGRKDQQMLYLGLRQAGHAVDLITEDDIADGILSNYAAAYFAGQWMDHRAARAFDDWVKDGGILYATAGCGMTNEFGEAATNLMAVLGLTGSTQSQNVGVLRTLLELPVAPPVGTITLGAGNVEAIGLRQELAVGAAQVLGTWENGAAAVTVNHYGAGKAYAVGTLAGHTYMKTGLPVVPYARGGDKNRQLNPEGFSAAAKSLVQLGVDAASIQEPVVCSSPLVEWTAIDSTNGTLVTLVNWSNAELTNLQVRVQLAAAPQAVRSVEQQGSVPWGFAGGVLTFRTDLKAADYFLLPAGTGAPVPYTLSVESARGTPTPPVGLHTNDGGTLIACSMPTPTIVEGGTQYVCTGWTGTGSVTNGTGTDVTLILTADSTLVWQWATSYWFGASAGANGSVGPTGGWWAAGSDVTVTAAPDANCHFAAWSGNVPPGQETNNPLALTMDRARSVTASFAVDQKTLWVTSVHGGAWPGTLTGDYGRLVEQWVTNSPVPAGAGTQYVCTGASVAGNDWTPVSPTNVTLTLTNDATLTWQWQTQYWLATATNGAGNVTPTDGWHAAGSNVALTAVADAHWHFAGWSGDTQECAMAGNVITAAMVQARSITAEFAPDQYTLTVDSAPGGAWPGTLVADYGRSIEQWVTNSPLTLGGTQYVCLGGSVLGNDATPVSPTNVTLTLTNDATLTWQWQTQYWLSASAETNGSVAGGNEWLPAQATGMVEAIPVRYYHLAGWTGTVEGTENPLVVVMQGAHSVVAVFAVNTTSNGVPWTWLADCGWTNDFEAAAAGDMDEDGLYTWEEYVAGTDPTNRRSRLEVSEVQADGATRLVLRWPSVSNRWYSVLGATNLLDGFEARPDATNLPATPALNSYTDALHQVGPVFYRIRVRRE